MSFESDLLAFSAPSILGTDELVLVAPSDAHVRDGGRILMLGSATALLPTSSTERFPTGLIESAAPFAFALEVLQ